MTYRSEAVQGQSELYAIRHYYTCVWSRVMCGSGSSNALWGSHEIPFSLEMEVRRLILVCTENWLLFVNLFVTGWKVVLCR